jgi:flavin reductase (DIM6/NTAB) family NADH-FMN oxidoreductase RutF
MQPVDKQAAERLLGPTSVFVLCTQNPDGSTHAASFSWVTLASYKPPLVTFASKMPGTRTLDNLRRDPNLLLCRPRATDQLAQKMVLLTQKSIPKDVNKPDYVGLELASVSGLLIKRLADCTMFSTAKYLAEFPVGDHLVVVAELREVEFPDGHMNVWESMGYCYGKTFARGLVPFEVPGY